MRFVARDQANAQDLLNESMRLGEIDGVLRNKVSAAISELPAGSESITVEVTPGGFRVSVPVLSTEPPPPVAPEPPKIEKKAPKPVKKSKG